MATADKGPRRIETASQDSAAEAREQATEYEALFGDRPLELDGGEVLMIPPHPDYGLLDDEKMDEWDELMFDMDTKYAREPDIFIPEQELENGLKLSAETKRGALMRPYRIGDEIIKPSHTVRVVQIALGENDFKRLKEGGRNASDVWKIWGQWSLDIKERQQRDSKSS